LYALFANWLLERVVMAGIRAGDGNLAFRIFESMNDRGARLTSVDLLKSYLLSNAGKDEDTLNNSWRGMLTELTSVEGDRNAPGQFLKAELQARYARIDPEHGDIEAIDNTMNSWVRNNRSLVGLDRPDNYHSFVDELTQVAKKFRMLLRASSQLREGLEEVYFNERNGLSAQMIPILAAIRPDDGLSVAREKARRIAAFVDRWYVLRTLTELPTNQRELINVIRALLPGLRRCKTAIDVGGVLAAYIANDAQESVTLEGFGLRGNNRHEIKYLLARLTSYAMKGCGRTGEVDEYLSEIKPYQIEHLFANKPERHRREVPDLLKFRTLRNQLGGLVLLPSSDNASLGAMPLDDKVLRYGRQNVLVGVLNKDFHRNFKDLREFAKANGVESSLRAFSPKAPMAEVVSVRQKLYLQLCARIWSLEQLGVDSSLIPDYRDPFSQHQDQPEPKADSKAAPRTDVARMVAAGVLQAGWRIVLTYKGTDYWAEICGDGRVRIEDTGAIYTRVDEAGCVVRDSKTCNGMKFWSLARNDGDRIPLGQLRDEARSSGLLAKRR
jgi:hypothetical protein